GEAVGGGAPDRRDRGRRRRADAASRPRIANPRWAGARAVLARQLAERRQTRDGALRRPVNGRPRGGGTGGRRAPAWCRRGGEDRDGRGAAGRRAPLVVRRLRAGRRADGGRGGYN